MSDTRKRHALFFTDRGAGPDNVSLWTEPVAAIVDGDEVIAPRTLGLRIRPHDEFPLVFARAGGYQMDETTVRALHAEFGAWLDEARAQAPDSTDDDRAARRELTLAKFRALPPEEQERRLRNLVDAITPDLLLDADEDGASLAVDDVSDGTGRHVLVDIGDVDSSRSTRLDEERMRKLVAWGQAWLDAPRDAARESAEVVAEDEGVRLLKTTAGEWGLTILGDLDEQMRPTWEPATWCASEADARTKFCEESARVICDGCNQSVFRDDATDHGDGYYCEPCADDAAEKFKRTRYRCERVETCGWTGMGPDADLDEDGVSCPKCGEACEDMGIDAAPEAGEAPAP